VEKRCLVLSVMVLGIIFLPTYLGAATTQAKESVLTLQLPFNTESRWTSVSDSARGITWKVGDSHVRFAIANGKFISTDPTDTWFIYGWFGRLEGLTKPYNVKYPNWNNRHNGIDFAGREGIEVVSASNGKVIFAGQKIGKTVIVNAGNDYQITYGHLLDISVRAGARVKAGETIGHLGSTGTINPHLHFEVDRISKTGRTAINPLS